MFKLRNIIGCALALAAFLPSADAYAGNGFRVLYNFTGGNDGAYPSVA